MPGEKEEGRGLRFACVGRGNRSLLKVEIYNFMDVPLIRLQVRRRGIVSCASELCIGKKGKRCIP